MNVPLVIIGPSCSGKSTIVRSLAEEKLVLVQPTWTTRPPRPEERKGSLEHVFVDNEAFNKKQLANEFLGAVQLFDLPYWYGLPYLTFQSDTITLVMLRAPLINTFRKHYATSVVYNIYDDLDVIADRLKTREIRGEPIGSRLKIYNQEVELGKKIADRSFKNNDLESTILTIKQSISKDYNM